MAQNYSPQSKPNTSSFQRPQPYKSNQWWSQSNSFSSQQDRRVPMVFVNENIKAPTIIIIDEDGNNLWTFPRKRAFEIAQEAWKDLVQMRYDQEKMTSTVKLLDYGKYMYQKQKDEKEKKKTQKASWLKE